MKTIRMRRNIIEFLEDGPKSSAEIKNHLNEKTRHGTTPTQLSNVLSRMKEIVQIGYTNISDARHPNTSYQIMIYDLAERVK